jgi:large subunit ribosomal protein L21
VFGNDTVLAWGGKFFIQKNFLFKKIIYFCSPKNIRILIMYAIVEIAGQQFKVNKDQKVFVHRQEGEVGAQLTFDKVYLIDDEADIKVGTPVVNGASVSASILSHVRGDKVLVFKKKRRKSYQKLNGHRQDFTQILIEGIAV